MKGPDPSRLFEKNITSGSFIDYSSYWSTPGCVDPLLGDNIFSVYALEETESYQSVGKPIKSFFSYTSGLIDILYKCTKTSANVRSIQFEINDAGKDSLIKVQKKLKSMTYELNAQVLFETSSCKKTCKPKPSGGTVCSYGCTTLTSAQVPAKLKMELKSVDGPTIATQDQTYSEPGYSSGSKIEVLASSAILNKVSLEVNGNEIKLPLDETTEGYIFSYSTEEEYATS